MELITLNFYHFSCQPDLTKKQEVMTILFQTILLAFMWGWDGNNCRLLISFDALELDSYMAPFEVTWLVHSTIMFCYSYYHSIVLQKKVISFYKGSYNCNLR